MNVVRRSLGSGLLFNRKSFQSIRFDVNTLSGNNGAMKAWTVTADLRGWPTVVGGSISIPVFDGEHHAIARFDEIVSVQTRVQRRFHKPTGERAVALVEILRVSDEQLIATIEHEAIISLP
jgi:hypothetical protein